MISLSTETIIRAWRDYAFRQSLSEDERCLLPANPAGTIDTESAIPEVMGTWAPCSFAPCSFAPCTFEPCHG